MATDTSHQKTSSTSILQLLSRPFIPIGLILLVGVLAYANTFNVPFLFDDNRAIVDNYLIKNLANLWPPSGTRWLGVLTFALNYAAGGLNVTGYHAVNLVIHLSASLLVYRLVDLTFRTPLFLAEEQSVISKQNSSLTALAAALIFVSHPIQTQAVTYIAQRFASLATMLFLASLVCYIQARITHVSGAGRILKLRKGTAALYAVSLFCAVLAMKTKEIAFTLPVITIIYELAFFPGRKLNERLEIMIPFALTLFIIPFTLLDIGSDGITVPGQVMADISRHDYLLTQFRVIVTYLRLLILPVNQMIDYVYPVYRELYDPAVFLSFLLLLALFSLGIILMIMGGRGRVSPQWRIAGFAGVWFFITLSVESSIIPITDVIFEHRLYLPSVGVFMALAAVGSIAVKNLGERFPKSTGGTYAILTGILLALSIATHIRNDVWRSELALWEDVARKSPDNARARAIIGIKLIEAKKIDQAIVYFQEAIRIKPDYADAVICLGNAYLEKGMLEEGYQLYLKALLLGTLDFESRAQLMMNIGNYNFRKGQYDRAIYYYQTALSITPNVASIHYNLGLAYKAKGMASEAAGELARARQLNPDRY